MQFLIDNFLWFGAAWGACHLIAGILALSKLKRFEKTPTKEASVFSGTLPIFLFGSIGAINSVLFSIGGIAYLLDTYVVQ